MDRLVIDQSPVPLRRNEWKIQRRRCIAAVSLVCLDENGLAFTHVETHSQGVSAGAALLQGSFERKKTQWRVYEIL